MIIKKLILHNFGIYAGDNIFEFDAAKPVVLINGMNGRGKTTFLEAVVLVLYGANSFLFSESRDRTYQQYLRSFVNRADETGIASIQIEFILEEDVINAYTLKRSWKDTRNVCEKLEVIKNGERKQFLEDNWLHFFEGILPTGIAKLFLFDGERIAELVADQSNAELKNSVKSLLGITVLDQMAKDLDRIERIANKSIPKNDYSATESLPDTLERLEEEDKKDSEEQSQIKKNIEELEKRIVALRKEAELKHQEYIRKGGRIASEKVDYSRKIGELEEKSKKLTSDLYEQVAGPLPLLMVFDNLKELREHVQEEEAQIFNLKMAKVINSMASSFISNRAAEDVQPINEFISFFEKNIEPSGVIPDSKPVYQLDQRSVMQIDSLVNKTLKESKCSVGEIFDQKKELEGQIEENRQYLNSVIDIEEVKSVQEKIISIESEIKELELKVRDYENRKAALKSSISNRSTEIRKLRAENYRRWEGTERDKRISKYSHMAAEVTRMFKIRLQKKRVHNLGEIMTDCYRQLANKQQFIQKITMDPETLDLIYLDSRNQIVDPESLSAGEKQLMVIALLWALAKSSKQKLPVIIDTPLSRLDSHHREAIVSRYYPVASEQVIILTTDSEITDRYHSVLEPYLDREYSLDYDEVNRCTHVRLITKGGQE